MRDETEEMSWVDVGKMVSRYKEKIQQLEKEVENCLASIERLGDSLTKEREKVKELESVLRQQPHGESRTGRDPVMLRVGEEPELPFGGCKKISVRDANAVKKFTPEEGWVTPMAMATHGGELEVPLNREWLAKTCRYYHLPKEIQEMRSVKASIRYGVHGTVWIRFYGRGGNDADDIHWGNYAYTPHDLIVPLIEEYIVGPEEIPF